MILEPQVDDCRQNQNRIGRLFLNRFEVGSVLIRGREGSWTFGEFTPASGFSEFAPVFGRWSLLMHADNVGERLSQAASEELRVAEYEIDAIRATLLLHDPEEKRRLQQLNIDGSLIEWKE